jgi:hypothetical protein
VCRLFEYGCVSVMAGGRVSGGCQEFVRVKCEWLRSDLY